MKRALVASTVVVSLVGGLGWLATHYSQQAAFQRGLAASFKKEAEEARAQAAEAAKWAEGYLENANTERDARIKAEKALAIAKAQIPQPRPAPESSKDLAKVLDTAGFYVGTGVYDDHEPSRLNRHDAEMTWAWNQQANMVPGLKASLGLAEESLLRSKAETEYMRGAYVNMAASANGYSEAAKAERERAEALESTVKGLDRAMKAKALQKWLYVGGAAVLGYAAGRTLR